MRRLASFLLLLPLLGGGCTPRAPEAAVRLEVSYTFKVGCIRVLARDDQGHEASDQIDVRGKEGPSPAVLAVFRQESWGHTLELITTAHEQSCEGPEVAQDKRSVTLQRKGDIARLAFTLEVQDADGDGYMSEASGGTDCEDSDPQVQPRAGIPETLCDEVDNDCDGEKDDGFAKGSPCGTPCPGGKNVCDDSHTGLSCSDAPPPLLYYPDEDGDGAGDERSPPAQVCPGQTAPAGFVTNTDDCDDQDKHNRRNKAELCDDRDNNCDAQRDENGICGGKGWKVVNDPALTGNSRQWKTVALGPNGRVWMAGDGGKLAVRLAGGQAFKSLDGSCGNHNWRAAWVRASDGHVLLAGSGGHLAEHNGNTCSHERTVASGNTLTGIVGWYPTVGLLFIVDNLGRMYSWTPENNPADRYNLYPPTYFDIHGLPSMRLLAVGGSENNPSPPYISSYPGTGNESAVTEHTLSGVPSGYNGALRGVWMASSDLAYAVGDAGLVVKWNGDKDWARVEPPPNFTASFSSVVVLDPSSIYVTDSSAAGAIRRLNATGAWVTAYTSDRALRDIAVNSPGDIWAVGDDGRVVHFPE